MTLSIDVWLTSEDRDCVRIILSPDISTKNLVMTDIQPAPVCQYLKVMVKNKISNLEIFAIITSHMYFRLLLLQDTICHLPNVKFHWGGSSAKLQISYFIMNQLTPLI